MLLNKIRYRLVFMRSGRLNVNGTSLIQIEALKNRRKRYFSTNTYVAPSQWDKKKRMVINHPNALRLNAYLYGLLNKVEAEELLFWKLGKDCTLEMLKQSVRSGGEATENFCAFARRTIENSNRKKATVENLMSTVRLLEKFQKGATFEDITPSFLSRLEKWLARNLQEATVHKHLRAVRTIINEGIKQGYLSRSNYPFENYKLRRPKPAHKNLTKEEVGKLEAAKLKGKEERVCDAFLFCCYTGLRFSDFVALRVEQIESINNAPWLSFTSKKTGIFTRVPLRLFGGKAVGLIDKWGMVRLTKIGSNYEVNKVLKNVCQKCGIRNVTFHVARHTCASLLLEEGVPINVIQKILGHTDVRTTQIYADTSLEVIERWV
jgi:integrase